MGVAGMKRRAERTVSPTIDVSGWIANPVPSRRDQSRQRHARPDFGLLGKGSTAEVRDLASAGIAAGSVHMVVTRHSTPKPRPDKSRAAVLCFGVEWCGLLRLESQCAVDSDDFAVEVVVLGDVLHQRRVLGRASHPIGERNG